LRRNAHRDPRGCVPRHHREEREGAREGIRGHGGRGMSDVSAALALAQRDFLKLLRDRARLLTTFIFPFVFIGLLGGGLQASFGASLGFNFLAFTLIGVLAQTVFQSTALGIISLLQDRET